MLTNTSFLYVIFFNFIDGDAAVDDGGGQRVGSFELELLALIFLE